jgi:methionine-rich copper-binding protein CopC
VTVTLSRRQSLRHAAIGLTCLLWLATAAMTAAHSDLVSSDPAAGSTIGPVRDTPIVLIFSEALKAGSKADIIGPAGTLGTATIDRYDDTRLVFTPTAPLAPGTWSIDWTSIATDGDVLRGKIPFTVDAAATLSPSPTTSAAPSASATATAMPSRSPAPSPPPSQVNSTGTDVLLPVIAAILAIVILGLVLLRNRRASVRR